jgi:hypothetical protein
MNVADLLVGAVSAIAGSLCVAAGMSNWDAWYRSSKVQWIVNRAGRTGARLMYIGGGIFFIWLGIAIACGFAICKPVKPNSTRGESRAER